MKKFAHLVFAWNGTQNPEVRQTELLSYFSTAEPADVIWSLFLLAGNRLKKLVGLNQLKIWVLEQSRLPEWLFDAALERTRDLTVTITRVLPAPAAPKEYSLTHWLNFLHNLRHLPENEQKLKIQAAWAELDVGERFLFNKWLSGGFRLKFPAQPLLQALAEASAVNFYLLAYRLAQDWHPSRLTFAQLTAPDEKLEAQLTPRDFPQSEEFISNSPESRDISGWNAVRDYPGVNVQIRVRDGQLFLWSENQEFLNPRFPEFVALAPHFSENICIFGKLTGNTGRRFYGIEHFSLPNIEVKPIIMASDIWEIGEQNLCAESYSRRRQALETILNQFNQPQLIQPAQNIRFVNWDDLGKSILGGRRQGFTGARLYRKEVETTEFRVWRAPEFKITTVLLYVQRIPGRGLRKGLELTFAVQGESELIPCARIAIHLTAEDAAEILEFVKNNTVEKFGPVRSIKPELIFEIAFDGVVPSGRHKAGLKPEAPRVIEWCRDKNQSEIGTLRQLQEILAHEKQTSGK